MSQLTFRHPQHQDDLLHDGVRALLYTPDAVITGTPGDDTLIGTAGNDNIKGLAGNDSIDGGAGNDRLNGGAGRDTLIGSTGDDTLIGGGGNDLMTADQYGIFSDVQGDGADTIVGGISTHDRLEADWSTATKKIVWVMDPATATVVNGNLVSGIETVVIQSGSGDDRYVIEGGDANTIHGGAGADKISVSSYDSPIPGYIYGDDGNDTLSAGVNTNSDGGAGDDLIWARAGSTTHDGGAGNDTMHVEARFVRAFGGDGEDLMLAGDFDAFMSGDDGNDTLFGDSHEDTLYGGAGNDWLDARGGFSDTLFGGDGDDTVVASAGGSIQWMEGNSGADLFLIEGSSYRNWLRDFTRGEDHIGVSVDVYAPGDGDNVVEGGVVVQGPGGFSSDAELVIVRQNVSNTLDKAVVAAAIGSATDNYDVGQSVIFVVDDGIESVVYSFESDNGNAVVEASELGSILCNTSQTTQLGVDDFLFV